MALMICKEIYSIKGLSDETNNVLSLDAFTANSAVLFMSNYAELCDNSKIDLRMFIFSLASEMYHLQPTSWVCYQRFYLRINMTP